MPCLSPPYLCLNEDGKKQEGLRSTVLVSVGFLTSPTFEAILLVGFIHVLPLTGDSSKARCGLTFLLQVFPAHNCLTSRLCGHGTHPKALKWRNGDSKEASLGHLALPPLPPNRESLLGHSLLHSLSVAICLVSPAIEQECEITMSL